MKDYTVTEAKDLIARYFKDVLNGKRRGNPILGDLNCGDYDCDKCLLNRGIKESCEESYFDNEVLAKVEKFLGTKEVDWSKVAVDTPIYVKNDGDQKWTPRHFAAYENGNILAWRLGWTSFTKMERDKTTTVWKFAKLKEDLNK